MVNKKLLAALWIGGLLCLADQLYYWGGVAHSPTVGPIAQERVKFGSPLLAGYVWAGKTATGLLGLDQAAASSVQERMTELAPAIEANPSIAARELQESLPTAKQPTYYLAPLLLLVAGVLQLRQPKQISTIRRR